MIRLADIVAAWNKFFFEPESPLPIGIYRFLVGFLVLANHALLLPDVDVWFSHRGSLTPETALQIAGGGGLNLLKLLPPGDASVWFLFGLSCLSAFCLMIGLFTRTSAVVTFVTLVTLHHRNALVLNSGDTFFRIATFYLIFSQAGAAFSFDRLIRIARGKEAGPPRPVAPWAMRILQIQLAFVYLYTFIWKTMGPMWVNGIALYYTSRLQEFWRFPVPYAFEHMWMIKLATWSTLFVEFAMGVLVWIKELRYWILLLGVGLHASIEYSMNIPLFGAIMISTYMVFVYPPDLERFLARVRQGWNRATSFTAPIPVFYDGKCSFCNRTVEVVKRLDAFHRFEYHDLHQPDLKKRYPGFDPKRAEREMLVLTKNQWLGGFAAFRFLARHMPLLWLVLPVLYLPLAQSAGDKIYQRVAERRYCLLKPGN